MKNKNKLLILFFLIILLNAVASVTRVAADWRGRFDVGGTPVFYDDTSLEDRTPFTTGLRLRFTPETSDEWLFAVNIKLRSELNSANGQKFRCRDLYARYGSQPDSSPMLVTVGIFHPESMSGSGNVMGAGIQFNTAVTNSSHLGIGAFGGANSVLRRSATDADGLRYGGYLSAVSSEWGQTSIGYVSVINTDSLVDEVDYISLNSTLRLGDRFDFYHTGEYTLSSGQGEKNRLTYYYANAGFDLNRRIRISVTYDLYDRLPYLAALPEDGDPGASLADFDRYAAYRGQSIGPRIDFYLGSDWRVYGRYRYRKTDDFMAQTWHQGILGFGYTDGNTGLTVNGSAFVNRGDTKEYTTGFLRVGRDFGQELNLSLNLTADRFAYPETVAEAPHVKSSWRAGISSFYRIGRSTTAILEYERTFADSDRNSDHRVMVNWQYRF